MIQFVKGCMDSLEVSQLFFGELSKSILMIHANNVDTFNIINLYGYYNQWINQSGCCQFVSQSFFLENFEYNAAYFRIW